MINNKKRLLSLEDFVNRNIVRASTTKRAQARRKQLEKMERLERPETDDKSIHFQFHSEKDSGNEVLDVEQAKVGYDEQILAGRFHLMSASRSVLELSDQMESENQLYLNLFSIKFR
jgi:ATPase subunit of ABC transporter with duplicated ATPase domains